MSFCETRVKATLENFDEKAYLNYNKDVKSEYDKSADKENFALNHFKKFGINENRYQLNPKLYKLKKENLNG